MKEYRKQLEKLISNKRTNSEELEKFIKEVKKDKLMKGEPSKTGYSDDDKEIIDDILKEIGDIISNENDSTKTKISKISKMLNMD
ncbi:MAG: hypothetical protein ACW981_21240 [Candidatus Hodarchaeales archaeon]|jgi:predicted phosphatase